MKKRNAEIELLRFAFAVAVLLFHTNKFYGTERLFPGGNFSAEFFFLVAGYLLMQHVSQSKSDFSAGKETVQYLQKKISVLFPMILIAWILTFGLICSAQKLTSVAALQLFAERWWEILCLKMTGLDGGDVDNVVWAVSAIILSIAILYPLLRKYQDTMLYIILPISAALILGWLFQNGALRTKQQNWYGFAYKGMLHGFAVVSCGVICFPIAQYLKQLHLTRFAKILVTVLKWACFLSVFAAMFVNFPNKGEYSFLLVLAVGIILTFSECGIDIGWYNRKIASALGKVSFPLLLSFMGIRNYWKVLFPEITEPNSITILYVLLSCMVALFVMLLSKIMNLLLQINSKNQKNIFKRYTSSLKNLKKNQFLFEELVKRDFKQKYKRTVLGMGWSVLSPLLTLLVMKVVFTEFFGRNTQYFTTYMFCGNIVYTYYKESTKSGMSALMDNKGIITKINVPKYLFLLSKNVSSLINFGLTLVLLFIFAAIDGVPFGFHFLALIYPIVCLVVFNIGIGLILSALFVFFRDISYLYDVFTLMVMYCSAIFYQVDRYPASVRQVFFLNPVYCYIDYFRVVTMKSQLPDLKLHLLCAVYAVAALVIGGTIYKKQNQKFLYYM